MTHHIFKMFYHGRDIPGKANYIRVRMSIFITYALGCENTLKGSLFFPRGMI